MHRVTVQRIANIAGTHVLYRCAGRNDGTESLLRHYVLLGSIHDCLIVDHLIGTQCHIGYSSGILRECPGHIPNITGIGIGLFAVHILHQLLDVIPVGLSLGTALSTVLQEDNIPLLVQDTVLHSDVFHNIPVFVAVLLIVSVYHCVLICILHVTLQGTLCQEQSADHDIGTTLILCHFIQEVGGVQTKATGNNQHFQCLAVTQRRSGIDGWLCLCGSSGCRCICLLRSSCAAASAEHQHRNNT